MKARRLGSALEQKSPWQSFIAPNIPQSQALLYAQRYIPGHITSPWTICDNELRLGIVDSNSASRLRGSDSLRVLRNSLLYSSI
jgi:hypothetical protein